MNLAFYTSYNTFRYQRIGGLESIVRRVSEELLRRGISVEFVFSSSPQDRQEQTPSGVTVRYYKKQSTALHELQRRYNHVVTLYLPPKKRLEFALFRSSDRTTTYHYYYTVFSESVIKRKLLFAEGRLFPYSGNLYCVSRRLREVAAQVQRTARLLLPPVPEQFFLEPRDKKRSSVLRIAYMGRIDAGKGVPFIMSLFRRLARMSKVRATLHGYTWASDQRSYRLHQELLRQRDFDYNTGDCEEYDGQVDERIMDILSETDVLILPYRKLSSSIDTPLVMLEGMAHLCVVVTPPLGNLAEIYGTDEYLLHPWHSVDEAQSLLGGLRERLPEERQRILEQNKKLGFDTRNVASHLVRTLSESARKLEEV